MLAGIRRSVIPLAFLLAVPAWAGDSGEPTRAIEGVVLDGEERPVPGVEVRAFPEMWTWGRPAWCGDRTDAEGKFSIEGCLDEPHRVKAIRWSEAGLWHTDPMDLGSEPVVGVFPGNSGLRLYLTLPGSIAGSVRDGTGKPLTDVAVHLCRGDTGYDGSPFGTFGATVSVPCRLVDGSLVPGPPRDGVREKRVRSWGSGTEEPDSGGGPLDEIPYSWRVLDDQLRVEKDGALRIPEVRRGYWRLEVDDIRAIPTTLEFGVLAGGEARPELVVRRRGWLSVRVRDSAGGPIEGATVAVLDAESTPLPVLVEAVVLSRFGGMHGSESLRELFDAIVRTGREGVTAPRYLDPGPYAVRVFKKGIRTLDTRIAVAGGKEAVLEARLEREP